EVGGADEHRHQEELRAEHICVVVVPEGKTRQDARVLEDVAHHETDDNEHGDAAPAIAQRSVNERESNRYQEHYGDWDGKPERDVRNQGETVGRRESP